MPGPLLIVGVSGWLGAAVRAEGERRGCKVVGVGRRASASVDIVAIDASEIATAIVAVAPSVVFNCTGVATGDFANMRRVNVDLVHALVDASGKAGARFVHVGSAAEIGDPGSAQPLAEDCLLAPISDYGRTKADGSMAVISSSSDAVVARLFNVAGASPPGGSFLAELVAKVRGSGNSVVLGNADVVRDWISIEFAAQAVVALGEMQSASRLVHVCSGRGISHRELASALGRRLGRDVEVSSRGLPGVAAVVGNPDLLQATWGLRTSLRVGDLAKCVLLLDE